MWRLETQRNRVAAVVRVGALPGILEILTPMRDTDFDGASAAGSPLPVLWLPATSWPATIRRSKVKNQPNSRHPEHGGWMVAGDETSARHRLPGRREAVAA
jgi:hypothetical protein